MEFKDVMEELKGHGTEQNVKVYRRHGATGELFGVSFANLNTVKKKIKVDHALAMELWQSKNVDARTLATMVADPGRFKSSDADKWVKELDYYLLSDLLASFVARCDFAPQKINKWMKSKQEYIRATGYSVLASYLKNGASETKITDKDCKVILGKIETEIHSSPNRARHAMNNAVIAIGVFRPSMTEEAISTAKRIGKVEVDHGETSCKTPEAIGYIKKSLNRKKS